eukprot:238322_1
MATKTRYLKEHYKDLAQIPTHTTINKIQGEKNLYFIKHEQNIYVPHVLTYYSTKHPFSEYTVASNGWKMIHIDVFIAARNQMDVANQKIATKIIKIYNEMFSDEIKYNPKEEVEDEEDDEEKKEGIDTTDTLFEWNFVETAQPNTKTKYEETETGIIIELDVEEAYETSYPHVITCDHMSSPVLYLNHPTQTMNIDCLQTINVSQTIKKKLVKYIRLNYHFIGLIFANVCTVIINAKIKSNGSIASACGPLSKTLCCVKLTTRSITDEIHAATVLKPSKCRVTYIKGSITKIRRVNIIASVKACGTMKTAFSNMLRLPISQKREATVILRHRLSLVYIFLIACQVMDDYTNNAMLHLDIKPENILFAACADIHPYKHEYEHRRKTKTNHLSIHKIYPLLGDYGDCAINEDAEVTRSVSTCHGTDWWRPQSSITNKSLPPYSLALMFGQLVLGEGNKSAYKRITTHYGSDKCKMKVKEMAKEMGQIYALSFNAAGVEFILRYVNSNKKRIGIKEFVTDPIFFSPYFGLITADNALRHWLNLTPNDFKKSNVKELLWMKPIVKKLKWI